MNCVRRRKARALAFGRGWCSGDGRGNFRSIWSRKIARSRGRLHPSSLLGPVSHASCRLNLSRRFMRSRLRPRAGNVHIPISSLIPLDNNNKRANAANRSRRAPIRTRKPRRRRLADGTARHAVDRQGKGVEQSWASYHVWRRRDYLSSPSAAAIAFCTTGTLLRG